MAITFTHSKDKNLAFSVEIIGKHQFKMVPPEGLEGLELVFLRFDQATNLAQALSEKSVRTLRKLSRDRVFSITPEERPSQGRPRLVAC